MLLKPKRIDRAARHAFTLIEILCVVAILGIVATIAIPSIAPQDDLTVSAACRIVIADLLYAQNQAITTGSPTYVSLTTAGQNSFGSYRLYNNANLTTLMMNPVSQQSYTQNCGAGSTSPFTNVAITGLNLNGSLNTVLVFDSLGSPSVCPMSNTAAPVPLSSAATIELQCGAMSVMLSIEPNTGNITASAVQSQ